MLLPKFSQNSKLKARLTFSEKQTPRRAGQEGWSFSLQATAAADEAQGARRHARHSGTTHFPEVFLSLKILLLFKILFSTHFCLDSIYSSISSTEGQGDCSNI